MIVAQVRRTLHFRKLVDRGQGVVLACSGGPDSVAMVHAMARLAQGLALDLRVASVDHGLRPEAKDEVRMVRELSGSLGLPFHALSVEVPGGASLQAQAREARYGALLGLMREEGCERLAVAHTREDQAETLLSRLLRGSGLDGLAGISPHRSDGVIRPLIDCARSDVHAHVRHHGLSTVDDPSNRDRRFERVRLREQVIPVLLAEDPSLITHLCQVADDARAVRQSVDAHAVRLLDSARTSEGLLLGVLSKAHTAERITAFRLWIEQSTGSPPGRAHIEALEALLRGDDGAEVLLGGGYSATRSGSRVVLGHRPDGGSRSLSPSAEDGTTSQNH